MLFRYHDQMGHLGVEKTVGMILQNYWFPNLMTKLKEHIANCLKCIAYSPKSGKFKGTLHPIPNLFERRDKTYLNRNRQSNGQVECTNRTLIPILSTIVNKEEGKNWYKLLHEAEYAINNSKNQSTSRTTRLLFGIDQRGQINDEIKEYVNANVCTRPRNLEETRKKAAEKISAKV